MKVLRLFLLATIFGAVLLTPGSGAFGDCPASFYSWDPPTTATTSGPASAPAQDTSFNPSGISHSYFAQGTTLFAVRNVAEPGCALGDCAAGGIQWTWQPTPPSTISNFPSPVPLSESDTAEFLFLTAEDGFLYKIDAADGTTKLARDTRRLLSPPDVFVCASDKLIATPAVQLYRFANKDFQNDVDTFPGHAQDDVVIVITRNECGDTTHNRVIAYWARDLTVKWIFNGTGDLPVDFGSEGCAIDYGSNTLFCGTNLDPGTTSQDSLWAIDSLTGGLRWSDNAGPIVNRPMIANGRLYVASFTGAVRAFDPAGDPSNPGMAKALWTTSVQLPAVVVRNLWAEFRGGPFQGDLLVIDVAGSLWALQDMGSLGRILWTATAGAGVSFRSMPVVDPSANKGYIGRDDGRVQQIDLAGGALEGTMQVTPVIADVYDPSLDVEGGASDINRLVVAAGGATATGGMVTRINLPLCVESAPAAAGRAGAPSP